MSSNALRRQDLVTELTEALYELERMIVQHSSLILCSLIFRKQVMHQILVLYPDICCTIILPSSLLCIKLWCSKLRFGLPPFSFLVFSPREYRPMERVNFVDNDTKVEAVNPKTYVFEPNMSRGSEDDLIRTVNIPAMVRRTGCVLNVS